MLQKNIKTLFNCNLDIIINGIESNSKNVKNGNLFICRVGININGYDYIEDAVKNGAVAIICSKKPKIKIPYILVDDVNENIAYIFEWFYGDINKKFKNIIGVTGTSGKTSIINIINHIIENEYKSFFVGTNGISYMSKEEKDILNTTYPIEQYYKIMYNAYKQKLDTAIIELSSYGLKYNRIGNTLLDFAIVTNLSEAHLNEHKDFNDYIESKLKIIDHIKKDGYLIINYDDKYKDKFIKKFAGNILTFGSNENADISFYNINCTLNDTSFIIKYKNKKYEVKTKLIGITNIYNVCVSILVANLVGVDIEKCIKYLSNYYVKGRMENYKNTIIDFAVTPIALKKNISFINEHKKGRLISVIGKIEDREINEYKKFGNISTKYSDYVIFTTDKNKTNKSLAVKYMTESLDDNNYEIILDRKEAIKKGLAMLRKYDILYIVGCEYFFRTSYDKDINPYEIIDTYK